MKRPINKEKIYNYLKNKKPSIPFLMMHKMLFYYQESYLKTNIFRSARNGYAYILNTNIDYDLNNLKEINFLKI